MPTDPPFSGSNCIGINEEQFAPQTRFSALELFQGLRALGGPMFSLLKGGYSRDLPELILACLKGGEGLSC